jgi:hypothetical protein
VQGYLSKDGAPMLMLLVATLLCVTLCDDRAVDLATGD